MKKATLFIGSLALLCLVFTLYGFIAKPKVAFIHVQEVYNDFEYKKELESKFEKVQTARKRILDSLEIKINVLAKNIQNSEVNKEMNIQNYQYLATQYQNNEKTFVEDNAAISEQYTKEIWTQLNKYIEEYGKEKGYAFIYGADGSGSVMYAEKGYNITNELKIYVNERFIGGNLDE